MWCEIVVKSVVYQRILTFANHADPYTRSAYTVRSIATLLLTSFIFLSFSTIGRCSEDIFQTSCRIPIRGSLLDISPDRDKLLVVGSENIEEIHEEYGPHIVQYEVLYVYDAEYFELLNKIYISDGILQHRHSMTHFFIDSNHICSCWPDNGDNPVSYIYTTSLEKEETTLGTPVATLDADSYKSLVSSPLRSGICLRKLNKDVINDETLEIARRVSLILESDARCELVPAITTEDAIMGFDTWGYWHGIDYNSGLIEFDSSFVPVDEFSDFLKDKIRAQDRSDKANWERHISELDRLDDDLSYWGISFECSGAELKLRKKRGELLAVSDDGRHGLFRLHLWYWFQKHMRCNVNYNSPFDPDAISRSAYRYSTSVNGDYHSLAIVSLQSGRAYQYLQGDLLKERLRGNRYVYYFETLSLPFWMPDTLDIAEGTVVQDWVPDIFTLNNTGQTSSSPNDYNIMRRYWGRSGDLQREYNLGEIDLSPFFRTPLAMHTCPDLYAQNKEYLVIVDGDRIRLFSIRDGINLIAETSVDEDEAGQIVTVKILGDQTILASTGQSIYIFGEHSLIAPLDVSTRYVKQEIQDTTYLHVIVKYGSESLNRINVEWRTIDENDVYMLTPDAEKVMPVALYYNEQNPYYRGTDLPLKQNEIDYLFIIEDTFPSGTYSFYFNSEEVRDVYYNYADGFLGHHEIALPPTLTPTPTEIPTPTITPTIPLGDRPTRTPLPVFPTPDESLPYVEIAIFDELNVVDPKKKQNYILTNDLDASGRSFTEIQLGSSIFDGDGHVIRNLDLDHQSVFRYNLGLIRNLGIENIVVNGSPGALLNTNNGTISNCFVIGSVECDSEMVGGIVSLNQGNILQCFTDVNIGRTAFGAGGIAGENHGCISECYTIGDAAGYSFVGGLVGKNFGIIERSFSSGSVYGKHRGIGGLVGMNSEGKIEESYADCKVRGEEAVAGLVGHNQLGDVGAYFATIRGSYAAGTVMGSRYAGGLVGINAGGVVEDSFTVATVKGREEEDILIAYNLAESEDGNGMGHAVEDRGDHEPFKYPRWDFENTWFFQQGVDDGKPRLRVFHGITGTAPTPTPILDTRIHRWIEY